MADTASSNHPAWKADEQDSARAEEIRTALRDVADPELGLNVIELGMIRDLVFEPGKISAKMILTTPFCPYGPAMIEQVRRKIAAVSQLPATVELSPEMWDRSMMEDGAGGDWGLFGGY